MKHGPIHYRSAQIERVAAVAGKIDFHPTQPAIVFNAHIIAHVKRMSLAGYPHVIASGQAHFNRPAGQACRDGAQAGHARRLGFFTAKTATHSAHINRDLIHADAHDLCHQLLDLRGVLRGAEYLQRVVLTRDHHGRLGFQIEVFLPANMKRALYAVRRTGQRRLDVAALVDMGLLHKTALQQSLFYIQQRGQYLILDHRRHRALSGRIRRVGQHGNNNLPNIFDAVLSQQRVAGLQRADIVDAGHVLPGEDADDTGNVVARLDINVSDTGMGMIAQARTEMQQTGLLRFVIDIYRLAGHVFIGAFMLIAAPHAAADVARMSNG